MSIFSINLCMGLIPGWKFERVEVLGGREVELQLVNGFVGCICASLHFRIPICILVESAWHCMTSLNDVNCHKTLILTFASTALLDHLSSSSPHPLLIFTWSSPHFFTSSSPHFDFLLSSSSPPLSFKLKSSPWPLWGCCRSGTFQHKILKLDHHLVERSKDPNYWMNRKLKDLIEAGMNDPEGRNYWTSLQLFQYSN